jgi:hypothetical protein
MAKENDAFLTAIGIFIGIVVANSLETVTNLSSLPDSLWLIISLTIIFLSIVFIYEMIFRQGGKRRLKSNWIEKGVEALRIAVVLFVGFFPFSFQRMFNNHKVTATSSFWGIGFFMLHFGLIIASLAGWNIVKKKLNNEKVNYFRSLIGYVLFEIVLLIIFFAIHYRGI